MDETFIHFETTYQYLLLLNVLLMVLENGAVGKNVVKTLNPSMHFHHVFTNREMSHIFLDVIFKDNIDSLSLCVSNIILNPEVEVKNTNQIWVVGDFGFVATLDFQED